MTVPKEVYIISSNSNQRTPVPAAAIERSARLGRASHGDVLRLAVNSAAVNVWFTGQPMDLVSSIVSFQVRMSGKPFAARASMSLAAAWHWQQSSQLSTQHLVDCASPRFLFH